MLNRRLLRVKVFQSLYALAHDEGASKTVYEKNLIHSVYKMRDIYSYMLMLPLDLRFYAEKELDTQKSKFFKEDQPQLNLQCFIDNLLLKAMEQEPEFAQLIEQTKMSWSDHDALLKELYHEIIALPDYEAYAAGQENSFSKDKNILLDLFIKHISKSELFDSIMEELYLQWSDDKKALLNAITRTLQSIKENKSAPFLLSISNNLEEDLSFAKKLFGQVLEDEKELTSLISSKTKNWDLDRIAITDIILMKMALVEMLHFPTIPVKVSINEYLEIAKTYSTPSSNSFINGILDNLQASLKRDNRILKQGRGLVG